MGKDLTIKVVGAFFRFTETTLGSSAIPFTRRGHAGGCPGMNVHTGILNVLVRQGQPVLIVRHSPHGLFFLGGIGFLLVLQFRIDGLVFGCIVLVVQDVTGHIIVAMNARRGRTTVLFKTTRTIGTHLLTTRQISPIRFNAQFGQDILKGVRFASQPPSPIP